MAAPDSTLLAALRGRTPPARHLFFKMTHSQGTVLAWDGLGNRALGGDTYTGIGNMASISGVSYSQDLQTPGVTVTLNGVPLSALTSIDQNIRNETATITAAWFDEGGGLIASKVVFTGLGNFITIPFGERSISVIAHLRGRMADWAHAPQSFYTSEEQRRLYPGDTGMDYVRTLESSVVTGWGRYAESTGGKLAYSIGQSHGVWVERLQYKLIGCDTCGPFFTCDALPSLTELRAMGTALDFREEDTTTRVTSTSGLLDVLCDGQELYLDIDGDVRSANGKRIVVEGLGLTTRLTVAPVISSVGVATATTISQYTTANGLGSSPLVYATTGGTTPDRTGTPSRWKSVVVSNSGHNIRDATPSAYRTIADGSTYTTSTLVEETTGNAVSVSGGLLKCNGSNVVLSTTNVLLTSSNKRIYPSGGNVETDFLRIWG